VRNIFKYATSGRITRVTSTSVVIFTTISPVGATRFRITFIVGTHIIIIARDRFVDASAGGLITVIFGTLVIIITWWFRNIVTSIFCVAIIISHTSVIIANNVFIIASIFVVTEILGTFVFIIAIVFLVDASSFFIARVIGTFVTITAADIGI